MAMEVLREHYARQQSNQVILKQFINRLSEFYGGMKVDSRKVLSTTEYCHIEVIKFKNGYHFRLLLERDDNMEAVCTASHEHNYAYIQELTDEDFDLMCSLAIKRTLELMEIPGFDQLPEYERLEQEHLSYLVPKLMIIAGKAGPDNFVKE